MSNIGEFEKGLAAAIDNLPQATFDIDKNPVIRYTNKNAPKFFGYGPQELVGSTIIKLIGHKHRASFRKKARRLLDKETVNELFVSTILTKDGQQSPHDTTFVRIPGNNETGILVRFNFNPTVKTCTIEQQLENAASSAELIQALDALEDPVIIFDAKWRYHFLNKAALKVLNLMPDQLLGRVIWDVRKDLLDTEWERAIRRAMDSQTPQEIEEYYPRPAKWYNSSFYPSANSVVARMRDITELKETQNVNEQLMGSLHDAMEVYWSDHNRSKREKKQHPDSA